MIGAGHLLDPQTCASIRELAALSGPPLRADPTRLDDHVRQCASARGRWHGLLCLAESLDVIAAPRFATLLLLIVLMSLLIVAVLAPSA